MKRPKTLEFSRILTNLTEFDSWEVDVSSNTFCFVLYIQGHRTRFETFQTNNLSWFNDILIKIKTFLKSWDREIWYKRFNLCTIIFSWSQFLHIWKNQRVFCLIFAALTTKTNWSRRNLQLFSRFWRNQS